MKVLVGFLWIIVVGMYGVLFVMYGIAGNLSSRLSDLEKDAENMHKRISDLVERVDEIEWK